MRNFSVIFSVVAAFITSPSHSQNLACAPYRMVEGASDSPSAPAGPASFFFRIRRSGLADSYLLGTFHSETVDSNWEMSGLLMAGLKAFVSETDFTPETGRRFAELSAATPAPLANLVGPDIAREAAPVLGKYGLSGNFIQLKPWALFLTLAGPPTRTSTLDAYLAAQAGAASLTLIGLQTSDEMVASMQAISPADQTEILKETICSYPEVQDQVSRLERFYVHDDVADFLRETERLTSPVPGLSEKLDSALVSARNKIFMPRLAPVLEKGGAFVAVGAAHLYGPQGLLQSLRQQGYEVQPLERKSFLQSRLAEANARLAQPMAPLLDWLRANRAVPVGYVAPTVRLASVADLIAAGCTGECDIFPSQGVIYVHVIHSRDFQDPRFLSLLLGYMIQDVQASEAGAQTSCAFWQQKGIENLLLRSRYLASKGVPSAGLEILPVNCH